MTTTEFYELIVKEFPHMRPADARYCADSLPVRKRQDDDCVLGAVTNYARHCFTDYEALLAQNYSEAGKKAARSAVRPKLDRVLHFWKTGEGEVPTRLSDGRTKTKVHII